MANRRRWQLSIRLVDGNFPGYQYRTGAPRGTFAPRNLTADTVAYLQGLPRVRASVDASVAVSIVDQLESGRLQPTLASAE
jgi:hypothetical protein